MFSKSSVNFQNVQFLYMITLYKLAKTLVECSQLTFFKVTLKSNYFVLNSCALVIKITSLLTCSDIFSLMMCFVEHSVTNMTSQQ